MQNFLLLILLSIIYGLLLGWREVEILCRILQNEYWDLENFHKVFTSNMSLSFSTFHSLNGFAVLIYSFNFIFIMQTIKNFWELVFIIALIWCIVMYARNVMMHVILPLPGYKMPFYLIPLFGGLMYD